MRTAGPTLRPFSATSRSFGGWSGRALLVLALLVVGALHAPSAQAHSELVSISPADGSTLQSSPTQIVLTFSDEVLGDFTQVELRDATGPVSLPAAVSKATTVTQPVPSPLANGRYTVTYKIVSADSHPVSGQSTFVLDGPASASAPPASATAPAPTPSTGATAATATPTTAVTSSAATPDASSMALGSPSADTADSSTSAWVWFALALIAVLLTGAALALARRRRQAPPAG